MRSIVSTCFVSAVALLVVLPACSSSPKFASKKPASGSAQATKSAAPSGAQTAKPSKKSGSNVSSNQSSAVAVEQATCDASEEGLAVCVDSYAVFCASTKVYALNCAEAFPGSTCGELEDGSIDCFFTVEE